MADREDKPTDHETNSTLSGNDVILAIGAQIVGMALGAILYPWHLAQKAIRKLRGLCRKVRRGGG